MMPQITAGPKNPNGKLDWKKVREIRSLYRAGWSQGRIAREFCVSVNTIARVTRGESWQEPGMIVGRGMTEEELKTAAAESYAKLQSVLKEPPAEKKFTYGKFGEKVYMEGKGEESPPTLPRLSLDEIMQREAMKEEGSNALDRLNEEAGKLDGGLEKFIKGN